MVNQMFNPILKFPPAVFAKKLASNMVNQMLAILKKEKSVNPTNSLAYNKVCFFSVIMYERQQKKNGQQINLIIIIMLICPYHIKLENIFSKCTP